MDLADRHGWIRSRPPPKLSTQAYALLGVVRNRGPCRPPVALNAPAFVPRVISTERARLRRSNQVVHNGGSVSSVRTHRPHLDCLRGERRYGAGFRAATTAASRAAASLPANRC